ncbi:hypothetical protein HGRIS_003723 [Hohenbuehelia grisea]|uniref:CobW/HypB/UreG nucleotide-binding domain-containing protein n=1 Tax=Hohenbuehelia grisea TaxID=104357 RepID=A0ABR3JHE4_9AGAR
MRPGLSGSAFPATLAFQLRELERQTDGDLKMDAIVTVIDAENFAGYEDTSPTAKMQASYSDIILVNKAEHVSERALDTVIDHLNTLNDQTPKIICKGREGVDPSLIFGLQTTLFSGDNHPDVSPTHNDEVETVTIYKGVKPRHDHDHSEVSCDCKAAETAVDDIAEAVAAHEPLTEAALIHALGTLSKEVIWRVKGFIMLDSGIWILNWAFGRHELTPASDGLHDGELVKFTVMGERGEVRRSTRRFAESLGAAIA